MCYYVVMPSSSRRLAAKKKRLGRPPGPHAEHRRIAEALRARMRLGEWKPGEILPSLRALAMDLDSSVSAVRLALDRLALERQITLNPRRRWVVLRDPHDSPTAQGMVLFVLTDPIMDTSAGSYWMEIHRGVLSAVARMRAPLLVAHAHAWQSGLPDEYLGLPLRGIVLAGRFTEAALRAYERLRVPVSYADTPTEGHRLHSASPDNAAIAHDAVRRMIALGHRRIAFVRFVLYTLKDVDPDSKERQAGFARAMREAGLDASGVFNHLPGRDTQHSLLALLRRKPTYTAVLCTGAASAIVLMDQIRALGLDVPRDLGVCCVQGQTERIPLSGPALDFHDIACRAALLLDRPKFPPIRERIAAAWRDRGSLGPCRESGGK